jgi:cell division protein DivIC
MIRLNKLQELMPPNIKVPKVWINKFSVASIVFLLWILLFDQYNLFTRYKLSSTVKKLEKEKIELISQIDKARQDKLDLELNPEKYARENYYMKKDNEEVYIIK